MVINISNLTLWEVHSVSFVTLCKPPMMSPRVKKHIAWLLQKHVFRWISSTAIMQIVWSCRPICIREGGWVGPLVNWVLAGTRWVKCLLPSLAKPPWQGSPSQNEWHWISMDAAAVPEKLQLRNQCWSHTHPHEQQPVYCFLSVLSPGRPSKSSFLQRKRSYSSPAQNKPICWWESSQSVSPRVPYTLEHSTADKCENHCRHCCDTCDVTFVISQLSSAYFPRAFRVFTHSVRHLSSEASVHSVQLPSPSPAGPR